MGKRKHRDPAEREAREARRAMRAERSINRKVVEIAAAEYAARLHHELNMAGIKDEDLVQLHAEGFVGKHAQTTGELSITLLACRECEWVGPAFESVPTECGGEYRCPNCGHRYGGWLDHGALDLGIVTPPDQNESHDPTTTTG